MYEFSNSAGCGWNEGRAARDRWSRRRRRIALFSRRQFRAESEKVKSAWGPSYYQPYSRIIGTGHTLLGVRISSRDYIEKSVQFYDHVTRKDIILLTLLAKPLLS